MSTTNTTAVGTKTTTTTLPLTASKKDAAALKNLSSLQFFASKGN